MKQEKPLSMVKIIHLFYMIN